MNICVYGASSDSIAEAYKLAAHRLGELIAERGHTMIYGGGARGLMGAAARGVLQPGGRLIGVAPRFFQPDGVLMEGCTEFIFTDTMRERKRIMDERADAFIVMPGGIGTFDEFFETLTLCKLGQSKKPIALLNTDGYYGKIAELLQHTADCGFMSEDTMLLYGSFETPELTVRYLEQKAALSSQ